jgi:hypothetical protein
MQVPTTRRRVAQGARTLPPARLVDVWGQCGVGAPRGQPSARPSGWRWRCRIHNLLRCTNCDTTLRLENNQDKTFDLRDVVLR